MENADLIDAFVSRGPADRGREARETEEEEEREGEEEEDSDESDDYDSVGKPLATSIARVCIGIL